MFYVDLDGVLADFDRGIKDLTGLYPSEQPVKDMWRAAARHENFFGTLHFMSDGQKLWDYVKKYNPTILTGVPIGKWAPSQKREWVARNIGTEVPVITCWSRDKHLHAKEGDILIDDREKARDPWVSVGGVFILHTDTQNTIRQLKNMGL